jgi:ribosome maturation factor RimP
VAVEMDHILVKTDKAEHQIAFENIQKARLVPQF